MDVSWPSPTMTVAELLSQWPQLASVFLRRAMACVGCRPASFDTLAAPAATYGIVWETFARELAAVRQDHDARTL